MKILRKSLPFPTSAFLTENVLLYYYREKREHNRYNLSHTFTFCTIRPRIICFFSQSLSESHTVIKVHGNPLQFLHGESQGQGSLVGCRLWGRTVGHDWSDLAAAAQLIKGKEDVFSTESHFLLQINKAVDM